MLQVDGRGICAADDSRVGIVRPAVLLPRPREGAAAPSAVREANVGIEVVGEHLVGRSCQRALQHHLLQPIVEIVRNRLHGGGKLVVAMPPNGGVSRQRVRHGRALGVVKAEDCGANGRRNARLRREVRIKAKAFVIKSIRILVSIAARLIIARDALNASAEDVQQRREGGDGNRAVVRISVDIKRSAIGHEAGGKVCCGCGGRVGEGAAGGAGRSSGGGISTGGSNSGRVLCGGLLRAALNG